MSEDKVRAVVNTLGTKKIHGRHIESICKRGGGSFHGKVHFVDGKYKLEPKPIHIVREEIRTEGFVRKPKVDGPCVWNQKLVEVKPAPAKIQPRSKTPNLRLLRKQLAEGDFQQGISAAG